MCLRYQTCGCEGERRVGLMMDLSSADWWRVNAASCSAPVSSSILVKPSDRSSWMKSFCLFFFCCLNKTWKPDSPFLLLLSFIAASDASMMSLTLTLLNKVFVIFFKLQLPPWPSVSVSEDTFNKDNLQTLSFQSAGSKKKLPAIKQKLRSELKYSGNVNVNIPVMSQSHRLDTLLVNQAS